MQCDQNTEPQDMCHEDQQRSVGFMPHPPAASLIDLTSTPHLHQAVMVVVYRLAMQGDVKADNIFIKDIGTAETWLGDFGTSRDMTDPSHMALGANVSACAELHISCLGTCNTHSSLLLHRAGRPVHTAGVNHSSMTSPAVFNSWRRDSPSGTWHLRWSRTTRK